MIITLLCRVHGSWIMNNVFQSVRTEWQCIKWLSYFNPVGEPTALYTFLSGMWWNFQPIKRNEYYENEKYRRRLVFFIPPSKLRNTKSCKCLIYRKSFQHRRGSKSVFPVAKDRQWMGKITLWDEGNHFCVYVHSLFP